MASPDSPAANKLFLWLAGLIDLFVEAVGLGGDVYGSRVAFRLDDGNGPEPDVAYVRKGRTHLARRGYFAGHPDAAMEIVSPESVERDYTAKRTQFGRAGVPEYWIIDEINSRVTLLCLDRNGKYREVKPRQGKLHSKVIRGFWLRPEWLWTETRPSKTQALAEILA